jgi:hypothetical protein
MSDPINSYSHRQYFVAATVNKDNELQTCGCKHRKLRDAIQCAKRNAYERVLEYEGAEVIEVWALDGTRWDEQEQQKPTIEQDTVQQFLAICPELADVFSNAQIAVMIEKLGWKPKPNKPE